MKDRIKELRKALNLTQQAFADKLGLKRNTVGAYEIGAINPSNRTISLICREFNVDEVWLRTGAGQMFKERTHEDVLRSYFQYLISGHARKEELTFILAIATTPPEDRPIIFRFISKLSGEEIE